MIDSKLAPQPDQSGNSKSITQGGDSKFTTATEGGDSKFTTATGGGDSKFTTTTHGNKMPTDLGDSGVTNSGLLNKMPPDRHLKVWRLHWLGPWW